MGFLLSKANVYNGERGQTKKRDEHGGWEKTTRFPPRTQEGSPRFVGGGRGKI